MKRTILLFTIFAVSACSMHKMTDRVTPESLVNSTTENVSFGLVSDVSVDSIANWIKDDKPTDAEIACYKNDALCVSAQNVLRKYSVPFKVSKSATSSSSVALFYRRVTALDCGVDKFGCSSAVNSLQMVTNRSHFISPPLSDLRDASAAVAAYNRVK